MRKAIVTKSFDGCRDGSPIVEELLVDDIIEGDLATVAIREKWAVETDGKQSEVRELALDKMTLAQLLAVAEDEAIELGDAKLKADVKAAIELAREQVGE